MPEPPPLPFGVPLAPLPPELLAPPFVVPLDPLEPPLLLPLVPLVAPLPDALDPELPPTPALPPAPCPVVEGPPLPFRLSFALLPHPPDERTAAVTPHTHARVLQIDDTRTRARRAPVVSYPTDIAPLGGNATTNAATEPRSEANRRSSQ
jgi:hypothetical protein